MATYTSEPLHEEHVLEAFDCAEPELDRWLKESARHAQAMRTARTFVWPSTGGRVVAYLTLAAHMVRRRTLPPSVGRGSPDWIPSILIARLALDRSLQGRGLGAELVWEGLTRALLASDEVGARLVVVDALHEKAAGFYQRFGFKRLPGDPFRLVQKMSDIAAALRR